MDTPIPAEATAVTVAPTPMVPAAPVVQEANSLLPAIISLAKDKSVDVNKLEALLGMQAKMEERQAKQAFVEAFARLSGALPQIEKGGYIDLGKGRKIAFARFEDMDEVIRPLLKAEGFTISFDSQPREGGGLIVTGHLLHRSGHSQTATIPLPLDIGPGRNNLQAVGSTLAYAKRYLVEMLLNLVRKSDDDDGNKGGVSYITPEQCEELQALIRETGTDEKRFLATMGVEELGQIAQAAFTPGMNMLLSKRKKAS